jgi:hypothetical protein
MAPESDIACLRQDLGATKCMSLYCLAVMQMILVKEYPSPSFGGRDNPHWPAISSFSMPPALDVIAKPSGECRQLPTEVA